MLAPTPVGAGPDDGGERFRIEPVTTELQRKLLGCDVVGDDPVVLITICGNALLAPSGEAAKGAGGRGRDDGERDDPAEDTPTETPDLDALARALESHAEPERGTAVVRMRYHRPFPAPEAARALQRAVVRLVEDRFRDVRFTKVSSSVDDWGSRFAGSRETETTSGGRVEEKASGNERVQVYPVRTALTRRLASGADCLVEMLVPLEEEGGFFDEVIRSSIAPRWRTSARTGAGACSSCSRVSSSTGRARRRW